MSGYARASLPQAKEYIVASLTEQHSKAFDASIAQVRRAANASGG